MVRSGVTGLGVWFVVLSVFVCVVSGCGGFFCSLSQPVSQAGEQIIFQVKGGKVKMQIFIAYSGPSEKFSWVLPTPTIPQLSLGSNELFRRLRASTKPRFTVEWQDNNGCKPDGSGPCEIAMSAAGGNADANDNAGSNIEVLDSGSVGSFDYVIIRATGEGTGEEVQQWLDANGYDQPKETAELLDIYVEMNHVFVALKLQKDKSAGEIQPIQLNYDYGEDVKGVPCVPLQLTRIAATDDMPMQVFVLGEGRAVPVSMFHVEIAEAKYPWVECATRNNFYGGFPAFGGSSFFFDPQDKCDEAYTKLVTKALERVDGHGFVTDAAIPTSGVKIYETKLDISKVKGKSNAADFLEELQTAFRQASLPLQDPLIQSFIKQFIPRPNSSKKECSEDRTFYQTWNLREHCLSEMPKDWKFDHESFFSNIADRIVKPLEDGVEMVSDSQKLTRLSCFIDAVQMTVDPVFAFMNSADWPDVPIERKATGIATCNADKSKIIAVDLTLPNKETISKTGLNISMDSCGGPWFGNPPDDVVITPVEAATTVAFVDPITSATTAQTDFSAAGIKASERTMMNNAMAIMPTITEHKEPQGGTGSLFGPSSPSGSSDDDDDDDGDDNDKSGATTTSPFSVVFLLFVYTVATAIYFVH